MLTVLLLLLAILWNPIPIAIPVPCSPGQPWMQYLVKKLGYEFFFLLLWFSCLNFSWRGIPIDGVDTKALPLTVALLFPK
jgi:hypothetical protein